MHLGEYVMNWVALFSQTGSEIDTLSRNLNQKPDQILTNNKDYDGPLEVTKGTHKELMDMLEELDPFTLITLHGYLRIIPERITSHCKRMYNGHPALANVYPELRGLDPQKRTWQNIEKYAAVGSIVHHVIPEVDAGDVVAYESIVIPHSDYTEEALYGDLRTCSIVSWKKFLMEYFNENRH